MSTVWKSSFHLLSTGYSEDIYKLFSTQPGSIDGLVRADIYLIRYEYETEFVDEAV